MFDLNSDIFKNFQAHLEQRKQYLIEKIKNNEAKMDFNLMEEYDVLQQNIDKVMLDELDLTDI